MGLKTAALQEEESTRPGGCTQICTSLSRQTATEKISRTHNFIHNYGFQMLNFYWDASPNLQNDCEAAVL